MPRGRTTSTWILGLAAAAACAGWLGLRSSDGPWGMVPGGRFEGAAAPCTAAQWDEFAAAREVELEVQPERPRSVTTWSVVREGELFVPADFLTPWKRWPHQVVEDGRIRLRVDSQIFACRAERVEDERLMSELRLAAARKYDLAPDGRAARTEVWWFHVGPR